MKYIYRSYTTSLSFLLFTLDKLLYLPPTKYLRRKFESVFLIDINITRLYKSTQSSFLHFLSLLSSSLSLHRAHLLPLPHIRVGYKTSLRTEYEPDLHVSYKSS